ncbi:aminotransferase class I/II-fold pyridoxal phosphate-dependent enzyme [Mucisphaera calidilacus]|uniref:8-amino-7-oxononanoate synthase 2 n=1 Tax=Mucisphaera calidilacus TaxID=2527982 RepID=A0A518BWN1_9BACT|nr:8-amino-7-oxononanoate synthase [Mucisphaera calidilacus]QDU71378.1 8-amino-7-oxononanoate synthase 2 [Mucisphaera calidilacus]
MNPNDNPLHQQLQSDLNHLRDQNLLRSLRTLDAAGPLITRDGRQLINLASNDYLGLSQHPRLIQAAQTAAASFGVGSGASRLVAGHLQPHHDAEHAFADFKHAQAALILGSGYLANHALLTAIADTDDLILFDKLSHASIIDAARAANATARSFPHGDLQRLDQLLTRLGPDARHRFIVTDSVFSMDGDAADLPALADLADQHHAHLIVDEAHGTGVLGNTGAGLTEQQDVTHRCLAIVSTASKALGSQGGIITGSRTLIDTLINRARSLIYTTAPPPAQAALITEALSILRDEPHHQQRLNTITRHVRTTLTDRGWQLPELAPDCPTPIIPLIVSDTDKALALARHLEHHHILAPAIRPPTVAPGTARVRLSLRADLTDHHIEQLLTTLGPKPS